MRLFISVNLPPETADYLKTIQSKISQQDAKMSISSALHITLKFLGEIGDNDVKTITGQLHKVHFHKFKANLSHAGIFPNGHNIRIIWVGAEPEEKFSQLFSEVDNLMSKYAENDHGFEPHITLARVKFVSDKDAFRKKLSEMKLEKKEFEVNSFCLMKSTLTPEGPVYEIVEKYSLN